MNREFPFLLRDLALVLVSLLTAGCALKLPHDSTKLDATALAALSADDPMTCRYRKERVHGDPNLHSSWEFIREPQRTESYDGATRQGEIWERDTQGRLTLTHVFTDEKVALDYSTGDLKAAGRLPVWASVWSIVDPGLFGKALTLQGKTAKGGLVLETYAGQLAGVDTKIDWLPALKLPARIQKTSPTGTDSLSLEQCWPMAKAPRLPTPESQLNHYRHIDYSDLGDMETDPIVQKIVALSGGHAHGSAEPH